MVTEGGAAIFSFLLFFLWRSGGGGGKKVGVGCWTGCVCENVCFKKWIGKGVV